MNELHELHMELMRMMKEAEEHSGYSEDYKNGMYFTILKTEQFIKAKLEEYIEGSKKDGAEDIED